MGQVADDVRRDLSDSAFRQTVYMTKEACTNVFTLLGFSIVALVFAIIAPLTRDQNGALIMGAGVAFALPKNWYLLLKALDRRTELEQERRK